MPPIQILPLADYPGYEISTEGAFWSYWSQGGHNRFIGDTARPIKVYSYDKRNRLGKYPYVILIKCRNRYRPSVHSLVLETFVGPRPPGLVARHLDGDCRNPALYDAQGNVRLAWGTHVDNSDDQFAHGTRAMGSRSGGAKLTEADIPVIRQLRAQGVSGTVLARQFGVHFKMIYDIEKRRRWMHVP